MKRAAALLLVLCCLFSLMGCSAKKVYEADAKTFTNDGLQIELTESFRAKEDYEGYTVCYDSAEVAVFVLKEAFTLAEGSESLSLEEYAGYVYEANASKNPDDVTTVDGLTCMEYTFDNNGSEYSYFCAMFKGSDAFWLVQFVCMDTIYEEYKPYFIEWAKTVKVN